jgi:hypothetical protein
VSQLTVILLTSSLTLIGGVVLLIVGDVFKRFFIEPIYQLAQLRGKITHDLIFYADVIANPGLDMPERLRKTQVVLRRDAALIAVRVSAIPWYGLWRTLGFVPKKKDMEQTSLLLIGLSNSVFRGESGQVNDSNRLELLTLLGHMKRRRRKNPLVSGKRQ